MPANFNNPPEILVIHGVQTGEDSDMRQNDKIKENLDALIADPDLHFGWRLYVCMGRFYQLRRLNLAEPPDVFTGMTQAAMNTDRLRGHGRTTDYPYTITAEGWLLPVHGTTGGGAGSRTGRLGAGDTVRVRVRYRPAPL